MAIFFASCAKGLAVAAHSELKRMGFKNLKQTETGVFFEGSWEDCYRVNYSARIPSRILKPLARFTAYQKDELYNQIRKLDFTQFIDPRQTVVVESKVVNCMLKDQRIVSLVVKDAIVDQFRDKFGHRPDVDRDHADLALYIRANKNQFEISLDTTGESLFKRGYREEFGTAPLKENLAAGLVELSGWNGETPLLDPFCGSGTILIEAALKVLNRAPHASGRRFRFQRLSNFDRQKWERVVNEARAQEISPKISPIFGSDRDQQILKVAKRNAERAGVAHLIQWSASNALMELPPAPKGVIISNPPYGERMDQKADLLELYFQFGVTKRKVLTNWDLWVITSDPELTAKLHLKAKEKYPIMNGALECQYLHYPPK